MIPHFTFPFAFVADAEGNVTAAVNDQDTLEDVMIEEDSSMLQYFIDLVNVTPGLINPITPQLSESDDS
jgi:hypothetical protein